MTLISDHVILKALWKHRVFFFREIIICLNESYTLNLKGD
nr:MAG TPA: hypothetical protein [Caudoviricetes sp.]